MRSQVLSRIIDNCAIWGEATGSVQDPQVFDVDGGNSIHHAVVVLGGRVKGSLCRVLEFGEDRLAFRGHLPARWRVVSGLIGHVGLLKTMQVRYTGVSDFHR